MTERNQKITANMYYYISFVCALNYRGLQKVKFQDLLLMKRSIVGRVDIAALVLTNSMSRSRSVGS